MFVSHRVEVTQLLKPEFALNRLEITFESAQVRAREIRNSHPEHNYIAHLGEVERMSVRKAAYHWGWDWGPKLMTTGPWRPVRLERYSSRVDDLWIEYSLNDTLDDCNGVIFAKIDGNADDEVKLSLRSPEGNSVYETRSLRNHSGNIQTTFALKKPDLWYPHGYGAQSRYFLDAELFRDGIKVHHVTRRIGFRQALLIQEPDLDGKSFYFRLNGVDIFAGGSCWIPADNFIPRLSSNAYRQWVRLMVDGNQIMTR